MRGLAIASSLLLATIALACTASDPARSVASPVDGGTSTDGAAPNGVPACDPTKDFAAPTEGPFNELDTEQYVEGAQWVTADELTVYYATNTGQGDSTSVAFDLWQADRASQDVSFGDAKPVPGIDSATTANKAPVLHTNRRILYFARLVGSQYKMMEARLGPDGVTWGSPTPLTKVNTSVSAYPSAFVGGEFWYYTDANEVLDVPIEDDGTGASRTPTSTFRASRPRSRRPISRRCTMRATWGLTGSTCFAPCRTPRASSSATPRSRG